MLKTYVEPAAVTPQNICVLTCCISETLNSLQVNLLEVDKNRTYQKHKT